MWVLMRTRDDLEKDEDVKGTPESYYSKYKANSISLPMFKYLGNFIEIDYEAKIYDKENDQIWRIEPWMYTHYFSTKEELDEFRQKHPEHFI